MASELAQQTRLSADRQSFFFLDKHATVLVNVPEYQELVHISVHKCIPK